MISLRRKPAAREPLDEETKAWYREVVAVPSPMAAYFPQGLIPDDQKPRFYVLQCPHCMGVHAEACPRVKSREHYENGALKRIDYFAEGDWNPEPIIWAEDVFG